MHDVARDEAIQPQHKTWKNISAVIQPKFCVKIHDDNENEKEIFVLSASEADEDEYKRLENIYAGDLPEVPKLGVLDLALRKSS